MLSNLPFALPAWMPNWLFLALILPALLYVLAFMLMPFSVFGVKGRIEALEAQVDALHEDVKMLVMRSSGALPPPPPVADPYEEVPNFGRLKKERQAAAEAPAPKIAPAPAPARPAAAPPVVRPARRTEPRLD
jgi:uncharacterized SAM-binding protein YcdF (DUF218 family)